MGVAGIKIVLFASVAVKRDNTALDVVLQTVWELSSPGKQPNLLEVVLHVGKEAKFGVQKVNSRRDICSRASSFVNVEALSKTC